ncbi:hypothetical protein G7Z17_g8029 [Cylindrodendrum hubeiense]|uniref:Arylesterase n=1 Tax=Cylindrodendrum hubeiense TaxID=595255 RepID=A0A9P5L9D9_9HYPO|nr:hypothetical protein G7Z17_g8029 [Cylindrodendrum hubeiense]
MKLWRSLTLCVGLAVLSPWLYDIFRILKILVDNVPGNISEVTPLSSYEIRFADHMRNCEDVVLDTKSGVAIVSCSPGRDKWNTVMGHYMDPNEHGSLYLYRYADAPNEPPVLIPLDGFDAPFHPLGLTYHSESQTLAVTNHGGETATIEIFSLDLEAPRATLRQTVSDPANLPTPNSLVFLNSTHLYASNTHRTGTFTMPKTLLDHLRVWLSVIELRLAIPAGSVSLVDLQTGTATRILQIGFGNGIDLIDDGHTLAVVSTIKAAVYLYSIADNEPTRLTYLRRFTVPFFPDNLSVDAKGRILVAGHPHTKALGKMVRGNWRCHSGEPEYCSSAPSWVIEWDPAAEPTVASSDIYVGNSYASSSSVVRDVDRNFIIVSGLYADGLFILKN